MSAVQETKIEGNPDDIENIAMFMRKAVSGGADTWSGDIGAAKTTTLNGWEGDGATAFGSVLTKANTSITEFSATAGEVGTAILTLADELRSAQTSMAGMRSTASAGGLTVSGTQIHMPTAPTPSTDPEVAEAQADAHTNKVETWNTCVTGATQANQAWQSALEKFSSTWSASGANMITVLSGLLTAGVQSAALANTVYGLRSTVLVNGDRFASLTRSLDDAAPGGQVRVPAQSYYQMLDEAADANRAVIAAERALVPKGTSVATHADDLMKMTRAGANISKGLWWLGIAGTGYGIYDDIANGGESVTQAVTSNVGGMLAGVGAGAGTGAIIGSFIVPPAGTIVGAAAGAIVGGVVGVFTSGMIDGMFEGAVDGFGSAIEAGWNELVDTGAAIADGVGAIGEGIGDVWDSIF